MTVASEWYKEQLTNRNYLSPLGFQLELELFKGVDFFCQAANIPDIQMPVTEVPSRFRDLPIIPGGGVSFGDFQVRTSLLFFGKMPVTKTLPNSWYNTPNLHMCTIKDLFHFCVEKNIKINKAMGVNKDKTSEIKKSNLEIKNFFSKLGIFLIG